MAKVLWWTKGAAVVERASGRRGRVVEARGTRKADALLVEWSDGRRQWVRRDRLKGPKR